MSFCKMAFDHDPGEVCEACGLEVDRYGNTEADFRKCSYPECGCDGARLCQAGQANADANKYNVEGMWEVSNRKTRRARLGLFILCIGNKEGDT
jgi:hypothetical protein